MCLRTSKSSKEPLVTIRNAFEYAAAIHIQSIQYDGAVTKPNPMAYVRSYFHSTIMVILREYANISNDTSSNKSGNPHFETELLHKPLCIYKNH